MSDTGLGSQLTSVYGGVWRISASLSAGCQHLPAAFEGDVAGSYKRQKKKKKKKGSLSPKLL
jgi:hypothetical protein